MNNGYKGGESLYGNCHIYKEHPSSPAASSLIGFREREGRGHLQNKLLLLLSRQISCFSHFHRCPTLAFRKINSDQSDEVQPCRQFNILPVSHVFSYRKGPMNYTATTKTVHGLDSAVIDQVEVSKEQ